MDDPVGPTISFTKREVMMMMTICSAVDPDEYENVPEAKALIERCRAIGIRMLIEGGDLR